MDNSDYSVHCINYERVTFREFAQFVFVSDNAETIISIISPLFVDALEVHNLQLLLHTGGLAGIRWF